LACQIPSQLLRFVQLSLQFKKFLTTQRTAQEKY